MERIGQKCFLGPRRETSSSPEPVTTSCEVSAKAIFFAVGLATTACALAEGGTVSLGAPEEISYTAVVVANPDFAGEIRTAMPFMGKVDQMYCMAAKARIT